MITHIVMWQLKEYANGQSKLENAMRIKAMLEGLKDQIDGIIKLEVGINVLESNQSYDIVLNSAFVSQEALDAYQVHPEHLIVSNAITDLREKRIVVDYKND